LYQTSSKMFFRNKTIKKLKQKKSYGRKITLLTIIFYSVVLMAYCEIQTDSARLFLDQAEQSLSIEDQIFLSKKALLHGKHNNDSLIVGDIYNFLGTAYQEIGIIDKSLSFYIDALELYKETNNLDGASNVLNNLGVIYGSRGQYEIALEHFKEAIKIKKQLNSPAQETDKELMYLSGSFNNIGLIHDLIDQKDSALYYFNKSLQIRKRLNDYTGISDSYSNIGITYLSLKENTLAERYLMMSFQIADSIDDVSLNVNAAYNLAEFYFLQGDNTNAEKYLNRCYERASLFGARDLMMSIFDLRSEISLSKNNYKDAYLFQKKYIALKDSLINEETESQIAQLQIAHEVQQKEERIILLKKEKQNEIQQNEFKSIMLLILYIFLFITAAIAFVFFRQKKKLAFSNKELVKRNLEIISIDKKQKDNPINATKKYASSALSEEKKQQTISNLKQIIEEEELFLKKELTIELAAEKLEISRTYLSQIVNETFNTNFTTFINHYRINHAIQLISDPTNSIYSIAGIAELSGFHSISSFNTLFKQKTGLTPSAFRKIATENN